MNWRHWILIGHWVLMFTGTHWPEINRYKPDTGWWIPYFSETVHFSLYAVWGGLWWWVLTRRPGGASLGTIAGLFVGAFAYACFDEATQLIVGRGAKFYDVLVDMTGVLCSLIVLSGLKRIRLSAGRHDR